MFTMVPRMMWRCWWYIGTDADAADRDDLDAVFYIIFLISDESHEISDESHDW